MREGFDFERLVELCQRTHEETRGSAVRDVNRLALRQLAREGQVVEKVSDLTLHPRVLEFLGLEAEPTYSENDLETAIIDRLQEFLLTPGKPTRRDIGHMQMRANHFDRHVKIDGELPTVGILLCGRENEPVVELTLTEDANIHALKYQLHLPSKEELAEQLMIVRRKVVGDIPRPMSNDQRDPSHDA